MVVRDGDLVDEISACSKISNPRNRQKIKNLIAQEQPELRFRSKRAGEAQSGVFLTGGTNEQVVAGFVGSQEYFQANGGDVVDWLYAAYRSVST